MSALFRAQLETGLGLQVAGQFAEAEAIYGQVIAQAPRAAEAWHLLGMARFQQDDFQGAVDSISRAILIDGSQAVFFGNLGAAYEKLGRPADAMASYRAALLIRPEQYDAACNLVRLLQQLGQSRLAVQVAKSTVQLHETAVDLREDAAKAAIAIHSLADAIKWLEELVELANDPLNGIDPSSRARNLKQLGICYCKLRRYELGIQKLESSVELVADDPETYFWLATAYAETSEVPAARIAISSARRAQPLNDALLLKDACLAPNIFSGLEDISDTCNRLESWLDEQLAEPGSFALQDLFSGRFVPPYSLSYGGRDLRTLKEKFAAVCRRSVPRAGIPQQSNSKRVRVGFFVSPGREHGFLQCRGSLLRHLDRTKLEVFLICDPASASRFKQEIGNSDLNFIPLSDQFAECVKRVSDAALDVIYYWEIGSDPLNYLIPLAKPAAIQCTSFGTQVTSGMEEVDFYLSSSLVELPDGDSHYTEKPWRLDSLLSVKSGYEQPSPATRASLGLGSHETLYLCPRRLDAVHPDQDTMFADILRRDHHGTLAFIEMHCPSYSRHLRKRFSRTIPEVERRIRFLPRMDQANYRQLIATADVVLDTIHSSAANTAYDVLGLGRPLVTSPGRTFISRYAAGCYARCGIQHLVAPTSKAYVEMALRMGQDPEQRASIERQVQSQHRRLLDDMDVVREHERFFQYAGDLSRSRSQR